MWRALMWLNLCGLQAVRRKLKKRSKNTKYAFYPFFELTTIKVKPHQCPSHQFIPGQQQICSCPSYPRTNPWNFNKKIFRIGRVLVEHFDFFFASFLFKSVTIYVIPRIGQNFDDYPDFQQKAGGRYLCISKD